MLNCNFIGNKYFSSAVKITKLFTSFYSNLAIIKKKRMQTFASFSLFFEVRGAGCGLLLLVADDEDAECADNEQSACNEHHGVLVAAH